MSKQSIEEMKAALDAFERDGVIQFSLKETGMWDNCRDPVWDFETYRYRPCPPKPEPPRQPRGCIAAFKLDGSADPWRMAYLKETAFEQDDTTEFVHMREVMPDEPQIDRTPWEAIHSGGSWWISDRRSGDLIVQMAGEISNVASEICRHHNRAICIKEEQA